MDWRQLALFGTGLNVIGVVGLFLFGMPFRIPMHGNNMIVVEQTDPAELRTERIYSLLSWVSLAAIVAGAAFQAFSVIATP